MSGKPGITNNPTGVNQFTNANPYDPPPPPAYSTEVKVDVLLRIADGETPNSIAKLPDMPTARTIRYWAQHDQAFAEGLARARTLSAASLIEEAMDSARAAKDRDSAAAGRVQTETFLKIAALLDPAHYAPKGTGAAVSVTINTNLDGVPKTRADGAYVVTIEHGDGVQDADSDDSAPAK